MQSIETVIRSCWDHYAFDDAIFLSEIYFAETGSDHALHLLATSYYRSGQLSSAYLLLKNYGVRIPETKFLFAKCCEDSDHLSEAEQTINDGFSLLYQQKTSASRSDEFGLSAPFVHKLLGRIFGKTNRISQSIDEHKRSLDLNPFLFTSFKAMRDLGGDVDALEVFQPSRKLFRDSSGRSVGENKLEEFSKLDANLSFKTAGNLLSDTPSQPVSNPVKSSSSTESVTPSSSVVQPTQADPKAPPKAPRKTSKRPPQPDQQTSNGLQMVTRQRSQPTTVLSQNQSQIVTRRSSRLFQNSVKENEIAPSTRNNLLKSNTRRISSKLRKSENEKLVDEMNAINKKRSGGRAPLIEKLCSLEESDSSCNSRPSSAMSEADRIVFTSFIDIIRKFGEIEMALSCFDCQKVIELVNELPERHRSSPLALLAVGKAYFELADYQKAIQYFEECHQKFDYFVKGTEYYSVALWHLQMELDLSALAQEMTEKHRHSAESWCVAGNCFSLQKEQETAIKFFQRAIQLCPDFTYAYTLLGHEYIAMEEYDQAMQVFRTALTLQPRHYNAWYGLGLIYYKQEKLALANVHFMRALKINPKNSVLLCHLSLAQQGNEFRGKALDFLDEALSLSPKNALCRYHKAQLLFTDEKYDDALAEINDLKQIAPKEPLVYFLAGKIHKKMGQPHLALMNFSWATELDPRGEQHNPILGDRRYDEEPVTALAALEPEDVGDIQVMDSDEST